MRIATIVTVYKQPKLVETLLRCMQHPGFHFYLHVDKQADMKDFQHLFELPNVFLIKKRVSIKWAGYSMVKALLCGIDQILSSDIHYDYINHLSGQCLPLKPVDQLYRFFEANRDNIYLSCATSPSEWWDEVSPRVERYHFHQFGFRGKHRLGTLISRLLPKRKVPLLLKLYGGPQGAYWTLTRDAAAYLLGYMRSHKTVVSFFKYTWGPDEIVFNSILMNSPFRHQVVNDNGRYIDWSEGGGHPKILTVDDFDKLTHSGCLFARKFDLSVDAKVVELIKNISYI